MSREIADPGRMRAARSPKNLHSSPLFSHFSVGHRIYILTAKLRILEQVWFVRMSLVVLLKAQKSVFEIRCWSARRKVSSSKRRDETTHKVGVLLSHCPICRGYALLRISVSACVNRKGCVGTWDKARQGEQCARASSCLEQRGA